jgi:hypothetical protein
MTLREIVAMPVTQRQALATDQSAAVLRRVNRARVRNNLPTLDRLPGTNAKG